MLGGKEKTCAACDEPFRAWGSNAYQEFCYTCRASMQIHTDGDAEAALNLIDMAPPSERKAVVEELKKQRRSAWNAATGHTTHAKPAVDQEKVNAAIRLMTSYGLTTPLPEALERPTSYVIAKNGLFEVRETDTARIAFQPKEVVGLSEELKVGVTLKIPRVPYEFLKQTVAFFRETCKRRGGSSEALVQIWWNRREEAHHIHVPDQDVSGGSVRHFSNFDQEASGEWLHVADIHSHGSSMGAFWSGVDDADERKAPEGRMFGVIGKVNQGLPEWRWRMRTREGFIDLTVSDLFEMTAERVPFEITLDVLLRAAAAKEGTTPEGRVVLSCPVDPFKDVSCPDEWHAKVKGYSSGGGTGMGFGGQMSWVTQYIYLKSAENVLEEFEVTGNITRATGKRLVLRAKEGTNVH